MVTVFKGSKFKISTPNKIITVSISSQSTKYDVMMNTLSSLITNHLPESVI